MQRGNEPIGIPTNIEYDHIPPAFHSNGVRAGVGFSHIDNVLPFRCFDHTAPSPQILCRLWKFFLLLNQKAFLDKPHDDKLSSGGNVVNLNENKYTDENFAGHRIVTHRISLREKLILRGARERFAFGSLNAVDVIGIQQNNFFERAIFVHGGADCNQALANDDLLWMIHIKYPAIRRIKTQRRFGRTQYLPHSFRFHFSQSKFKKNFVNMESSAALAEERPRAPAASVFPISPEPLFQCRGTA